MTKRILVNVGNEHAVSFTFPTDVEDIDFVKELIHAAELNPTVIPITNLDNFPVVGMQYDGANFIESVDLSFIDGNLFAGLTSFAYVVDGIVMAIHKLPSTQIPWIAAMMSSPTLAVQDVG